MNFPRLILTMSVLGTASLSHAQALPRNDQVRVILEQRIAEGRATGLMVGLLDADGTRRIVHAGSAGTDARPLGESTLFEIGSISKVFTGSLLAEMARRGEVRLEDPVARYLPAGVTLPSRGGREISLLDLATHRSGLPRLPTNLAPANPLNPYADYTVEQLYAFLGAYQLPRDIGSDAEYSNLGTGLLGHALALAAGSSYEEALRSRLLEPLGMRNTVIALEGEHRAWMAQGHDQHGAIAPGWDIPTLAGAGALRADVNDMLRWLAANLGSPESDLEQALRMTHDPRAPLAEGAGPGGPSIGLNWIVQPQGASRIIWHNGGTGGFYSFTGFDPARGVGVVVLSNRAFPVDDIGMHLLDPSLPLSQPPRQRTEITLAPEILQAYVGEYELGPNFSLVVTMENGALFTQPTGQPRAPIFPESETEFFLRIVDAQLTFQRAADGTVTGLILHQAGQNIPARKIR